MNIESVVTLIHDASLEVLKELVQIETYSQIGLIISIYFMAYILSNRIVTFSPILQHSSVSAQSSPFRFFLFRCGKLLFPIIAIMLLRMSFEFSQRFIDDGWVIQSALAIAILILFNSFVHLLITNTLVSNAFRWIGMPIIFFHLTGILDDIIQVLDSISIHIGSVKISIYGLMRTAIFGSLLFWLGRVSSFTAQTIIRKQESLDFRTREVFAKLFEVLIFLIIILLILQLMGINLTALAVFGGAVGVGIGLGLQAIASNFISGIIIIMDRSVSISDYIEMEDGVSGRVRELNMRSTTLATYDGKDIVVPNDKFITGSFINWTHHDKKQRYRVNFSVSYKTDVRSMAELIKEAVATHPQVFSGEEYPIEERPDCEIDSFGDSGINMFVEFWMEGVDDGLNRVGGDLYLTILETLQENGIEIPFPQREVHVINPGRTQGNGDHF